MSYPLPPSAELEIAAALATMSRCLEAALRRALSPTAPPPAWVAVPTRCWCGTVCWPAWTRSGSPARSSESAPAATAQNEKAATTATRALTSACAAA